MRKHLNKALVALLVLLAVPSLAMQVRQLTWDDLKPVVEFEDPFEALDPSQLGDLGMVVRVRQMKADGREVSESTLREAAEAEEALVKAGVDIDGLLAQRTRITELRRQRATSLVEELDGRTVRMPGFVLPLEYAGKKVTEFLLVPWVGACIHTPPPPANQIVHVIVDEGNARESSGMFEPVWVTGDIFTDPAVRNLFLKDGEGNINVGYSLQASLVEQYKNKDN